MQASKKLFSSLASAFFTLDGERPGNGRIHWSFIFRQVAPLLILLGSIGCDRKPETAPASPGTGAVSRAATRRAADSLPPGTNASPRWWKGNLHAHTLWSDGDAFPETVVEFYKTNGYHFLALSDHNVMQTSANWLEIRTNWPKPKVLQQYKQRFSNHVEFSELEGKQYIRLKPFAELSAAYEQEGQFLMIPGVEVTARHLTSPVHLNVTNPKDLLKTPEGGSVLDLMQNIVNQVLEQRRQTSQPMIVHVNHPNFGWGLVAEDISQLKGERFFEVYNGHPSVFNEGDELHPSTDRMWDIILTKRLTDGNTEPIYGLGVDDGHHYFTSERTNSIPGRGWIMVQSSRLTPEALIDAMEKGRFYASSGVTLHQIQFDQKALTLHIAADPNVTYNTLIYGTRRGYNPRGEPVVNPAREKLRITSRYDGTVGELLATIPGHRPVYTLQGNELYIRAKVVSDRLKANGVSPQEKETAWTQPVYPDAPNR